MPTEHRREAFAAFCLVGLLASDRALAPNDMAKLAVEYADALAETLDS